MKRKRGEPELEYRASSGVDERSNESSDKMQGQLLAAARGADGGNAKFAWYGAPSVDVAAAAVEHGFGRMNNRVLLHRAHGDDVHLSPPRSPYARSGQSSEFVVLIDGKHEYRHIAVG